MKIYFHPAAEKELLGTSHFYESKAEKLGSEFLTRVENSLEIIQTFPELGTYITSSNQRLLVGRFPWESVGLSSSQRKKVRFEVGFGRF